MYCLYVGVDYTYIDINALEQGIKSFLASQVWFQAVLGLEPVATIRPQLLVSHANHCMYVYMCICVYVCMHACIHVCMPVCMLACGCVFVCVCM